MTIVEERQRDGGSTGGEAGRGGTGSTKDGGKTAGETKGGGKGAGSTGAGNTGGGRGRGNSGSGGAMPGPGVGAGPGGTGNNTKTPSSNPPPAPTRPRTIGPLSGINFGGHPRLVSAYGRGGGPITVIRDGEAFAGRPEGGGKRNQIFGTKIYGSGYGEGLTSRGVANRPFPFYFWPVVWGRAVVSRGVAYLDATNEYGDVNNSVRPGGPLSSAVFRSPNSTFRVMSDAETTGSLVFDLSNRCSSKFVTILAPTSTPLDVNATEPRPEEAIQYYRASSIVLTLDGYNNSATFGPEGTPDTPLAPGVDMRLLTCLNRTIGHAAPLVDAPLGPVPTLVGFNAGMILRTYSLFDIVCLLFILWTLFRSLR